MRGFYDLQSLQFKSVSDVTIAGVTAPPRGNTRETISERLLTNFSMFTIPQPSTKSLQHIYRVCLCFILTGLPQNLESWKNLEFDNIGQKKKEKPGILEVLKKKNLQF